MTYADAYERFLRAVDIFNLNLGGIISAGCLVPTTFYDRLLIVTLGPMVLLALLAATYMCARMANSSANALPHIRKRHLSVVLWMTFLIYSSVSSTVFQTFACDALDNGSSYLRSDHSLACNDGRHDSFRAYASVMILVYPFGIPGFYAFLLWSGRKVK